MKALFLVLFMAWCGGVVAQQEVQGTPAAQQPSPALTNPVLTEEQRQVEALMGDHTTIATLVARCKKIPGDFIFSALDWNVFYGGLPLTAPPQPLQSKEQLPLTIDEIKLLTVSRTMTIERLDSRTSFKNAYDTYIFWSVTALLLGAVTTLFAALANLKPVGEASFVRLGAVGFPILSTVVVGYLALKAPDVSIKSSQRLGDAIARLHRDMVIEVSASACDGNNNLAVKDSTDAFQKRLNDIHDAQSTSDQKDGSGGNKGGTTTRPGG